MMYRDDAWLSACISAINGLLGETLVRRGNTRKSGLTRIRRGSPQGWQHSVQQLGFLNARLPLNENVSQITQACSCELVDQA